MVRRVLATVAAAGVLLAPACGGGSAPRLLRGPGEGGRWYSVGAVTDVGEPFSFGSVVSPTEAEAGEPITVESVTLVGVKGLTLIGVAANGSRREVSMIGAVPGFPPLQLSQDPLPLPGAVVPAPTGVALTFGVRRDLPGRGYATGFQVRYKVGKTSHSQTFPFGIAVCAVPGFVRESGVAAPPCEAVPEPRK